MNHCDVCIHHALKCTAAIFRAVATLPLAMGENDPELNISLEPHLQETLSHIAVLLPKPLSDQLEPYLNHVQIPSQTTPTIPYSLLQSISQWSRTLPGLATLKSHEPPLSPHDYSMIALLAGTITSPERKFPAYIPPDSHADQKREYKDRKTVAAILNALLSIIGSGAATWWAAAGWRPEWVSAHHICAHIFSRKFIITHQNQLSLG